MLLGAPAAARSRSIWSWNSGRNAETALADGKVHPREPGVELRAPEVAFVRGKGRMLREQFVDEVPHGRGFVNHRHVNRH